MSGEKKPKMVIVKNKAGAVTYQCDCYCGRLGYGHVNECRYWRSRVHTLSRELSMVREELKESRQLIKLLERKIATDSKPHSFFAGL